MRKLFSHTRVEQLRREAKTLKKSSTPPYTLSQAQDHIAQREGWDCWALLVKNSKLDSVKSQISIDVRPFVGGMKGVFVIKVEATGLKLATARQAGSLFVELPTWPRWLVRAATKPQHRLAPNLDLSTAAIRAVMIDGTWTAVVSVNGVQERELDKVIASDLPLIMAQIQEKFIATLDVASGRSDAGHSFRLFHSKPNRGVSSVDFLVFDSLKAAMEADLSPGCQRIGIPTHDGWWVHSQGFGWQPPGRSKTST